MTGEPNYDRDREFQKLLARRSDVDLTIAVLELARDACPQLDFGPTLEWIDARAEEISGAVARGSSERESLSALGRCLADRHGLHGDAQAYEHPDGSYLNRVIETACGLPITLSVLYMAVAERVHLDLQGVSAPMHFLTRYESAEGPLFLDAYAGGRILDEDECTKWVREVGKLQHRDVPAALKAVGARATVIRMLNNLKAIHARREEWSAAWRVQHRLAALQPASYQERRDLALIAVKAHRPGQAVDLLESCLRTCPPDEKQVLEHHLDEAGNQLARWN